jgi:fatty-acyl-CoA synthase
MDSPNRPPHHRIWPKRLPFELVVPQTSLYYNLEVAATR